MIEKGYCMKGDSCPYDHGSDALILDDVTLTGAANQSDATKLNDESKALPSIPGATRPLMQGLPMGLPFPPPVVTMRASFM